MNKVKPLARYRLFGYYTFMGKKISLLEKDKQVLIDLAFSSVKGLIENGIKDDLWVDASIFPNALSEEKGVFVAVFCKEELRGCIGTILPVMPIWQACVENARNTAFKDSRFKPIKAEELDAISFEVTIIGDVRPLADVSELQDGNHGIIVTKGFRREMLLPSLFKGLSKDRVELLEYLRAKVDLNNDDHGSEEIWEIFEAIVFSGRPANAIIPLRV